MKGAVHGDATTTANTPVRNEVVTVFTASNIAKLCKGFSKLLSVIRTNEMKTITGLSNPTISGD